MQQRPACRRFAMARRWCRRLGLVIGGSARLIGGRDQATMARRYVYDLPDLDSVVLMVGAAPADQRNYRHRPVALGGGVPLRSPRISLTPTRVCAGVSFPVRAAVFVDHLAGVVIPSLLVLATWISAI